MARVEGRVRGRLRYAARGLPREYRPAWRGGRVARPDAPGPDGRRPLGRRDARLRDYVVVVPEDAVGARGRMRHMRDASVEVMRAYFAEVVPAARVLARWRA